jgi:SAM-dependent methyltransferase
MQGDFERYLTAKATVDDRALDRRVLDRFRADLRDRSAPHVLEAGAGTAAFCRRLLAWEDLPDCTYVAVDTDPDLLATARERILRTARDAGFSAAVVDPTATGFGPDTEDEQATTVATLQLRGPASVDVRLVAGDAVAVAAGGRWDVLVAQAFVDLLAVDDVGRLLSGVVDGGAVFLPITFDGGTTFAPEHPADSEVLTAYHATMHDDEDRLGSTAGRRLLTLLPGFDVSLTAVGGADWVVTAVDGDYPADEAYFLDVVVDTVADAVRGRVPDETVDAWHEARRASRRDGDLGFVARNLDLYGRVDRPTGDESAG